MNDNSDFQVTALFQYSFRKNIVDESVLHELRGPFQFLFIALITFIRRFFIDVKISRGLWQYTIYL